MLSTNHPKIDKTDDFPCLYESDRFANSITKSIKIECSNDQLNKWSDLFDEPIRTDESMKKLSQKLDYPSVDSSHKDNDFDYENLRSDARNYQSLKKDYNEKAALAFSKKQYELASFYASQSHYYADKMKESHSKAGQIIFQQRCDALKKNSLLDLHLMHQNEALEAIEMVLDNLRGDCLTVSLVL